jgi:Methyltransferase domain
MTGTLDYYYKIQPSLRRFIRKGFMRVRRWPANSLFVPPGHFYSPIVDTNEAEQHIDKLEALPTPLSLPGIHLDRDQMIREWTNLLPFMNSAPFPAARTDEYRYAFENRFYSWGDGSVLHAMLRRYRPRRLIEIGCGWSSACVIDTVEHFLANECEMTFIEPHPAMLRSLIGSVAQDLHIVESPVQAVPLSVFDKLEAGDFLFIDSTHVMRTGSDVCFEMFEVLPRLAPGVFVKIHDIFWPFEYPRHWAVDENRSWNEIYALRAFLTGNAQWRIVFFNDYFEKVERSRIAATCPNFLKNSGGALWLQRC